MPRRGGAARARRRRAHRRRARHRMHHHHHHGHHAGFHHHHHGFHHHHHMAHHHHMYPHRHHFGGFGMVMHTSSSSMSGAYVATDTMMAPATVQYMEPPVLNPAIPYTGPLPSLQDGHIITVSGHITDTAKRFHINFTTATNDIALHIGSNLDGFTSSVVRNSCSQGIWGPEENMGTSPLKPGIDFTCMVLVQEDKYMIALNGVHFCEFIHRIPKDNVSQLSIDGDVTVSAISVQSPQVPIPQGGKTSNGCCTIL